MTEDLKARIAKALANGTHFVGSLEEARSLIVTANQPMVIQFKSLTVSAEDKMAIDALSNAVRERDIFIQYDEADILQTRAQRMKSTSSIIQNGALRN